MSPTWFSLPKPKFQIKLTSLENQSCKSTFLSTLLNQKMLTSSLIIRLMGRIQRSLILFSLLLEYSSFKLIRLTLLTQEFTQWLFCSANSSLAWNGQLHSSSQYHAFESLKCFHQCLLRPTLSVTRLSMWAFHNTPSFQVPALTSWYTLPLLLTVRRCHHRSPFREQEGQVFLGFSIQTLQRQVCTQ